MPGWVLREYRFFVAGKALKAQRVKPLLSAYEAPPLALFAVYPPARYGAEVPRADRLSGGVLLAAARMGTGVVIISILEINMPVMSG